MQIHIINTWEVPDMYWSNRCSPALIKDSIASVTSSQTTVDIWNPNTINDTRTSLIAHKRKINSFAVSPKTQSFICTCSDDKIVLWKINSEINGDDLINRSESPIGITFATDSGYVDYCTFSWNEEWLALCRENEILIIKIKWCGNNEKDSDIAHHATIETNSGSGNLCAFSPLNHEIIVTTEDSSYFKVWNLNSLNLLYKSPKLGMYTITHCSFADNPPYLLLGTNGGIVYIYNFNENDIPKCIMNVNVRKTFIHSDENSMNSEADHTLKQKYSSESVEIKSEYGELGCVAFGVYLFQREIQSSYDVIKDVAEKNSSSSFLSISDQVLKSILCPAAVVAVCCNLGIALYNCNTWECEAILKTFDMFPRSTLPPNTLPLLSFLVIGGDSLESFSCILKMTWTNSKIHILRLQVTDENSIQMNKPANEAKNVSFEMSVVPLEPVKKSSPLRYQMSTSLNAQCSPYASKELKKKSSGYGKPPRTQMFMPVINKNKSNNKNQNKSNPKTNKKQLRHSKSFLERIFEKSSITESGPPTKPGPKFCVWETSGTEVQLSATGDGENLACSSTASYISILKYKDMNPENGLNLVGHNGPVKSLHFSLSSDWLLSSSLDATAKVWDWRHKKCLLNIDNCIANQKATSYTFKKEGIKNPISQARFYYMDQFILTARQDYLELFSHLLHEADEPIQENMIRTKQVSSIIVPAQQITCFSAPNQFHSYIVVCCCSNHTLQVYDMNAQKFITTFSNIHSRPAHHMKQMEGSQALAHPPGMYNLFITAAMCDSTKLWDLRSSRCVQKYCQHINRAYSCGIDISPCGRYVATGSEDKFVYLYDTRKCGDFLHRMGGLGDIVMDVSFNPQKPILAAATLNGFIGSYSAS